MASTDDVVTLSEQDLTDIQVAMEGLQGMRCDWKVTVRTAEVELESGKVVHVRLGGTSDGEDAQYLVEL